MFLNEYREISRRTHHYSSRKSSLYTGLPGFTLHPVVTLPYSDTL